MLSAPLRLGASAETTAVTDGDSLLIAHVCDLRS